MSLNWHVLKWCIILCFLGSEDYNISTRNSPRIFDTKPYVRDEEPGSKSPAKKGSDSLTTLRTRGTAYQKPDLIKRKLENSGI